MEFFCVFFYSNIAAELSLKTSSRIPPKVYSAIVFHESLRKTMEILARNKKKQNNPICAIVQDILPAILQKICAQILEVIKITVEKSSC